MHVGTPGPKGLRRYFLFRGPMGCLHILLRLTQDDFTRPWSRWNWLALKVEKLKT